MTAVVLAEVGSVSDPRMHPSPLNVAQAPEFRGSGPEH